MKRLFVLLLLLLFIFNNGYCQNTYPLNSRGMHNKVNTCKNLLQKYTLEQLSAMIASGNFDDIYVGDYIEMEMTAVGVVSGGGNRTEKVRWLVGAIDYFYNKTNPFITTHHIVLVAEDCFVDPQQMNSTNTTAGGFASSSMYIDVLPKYDTAITNAFGASHVLSYHQLLSTNMGSSIPSMAGNNYTGASNAWAWANGNTGYPHVTKLMLMSEPHLYGCKVLSSSFYDITINNSQFPIFKWLPEKIRCGRGLNSTWSTRYTFWLSGVASATTFCLCHSTGRADGRTPATTSYGLRPYFLFY